MVDGPWAYGPASLHAPGLMMSLGTVDWYVVASRRDLERGHSHAFVAWCWCPTSHEAAHIVRALNAFDGLLAVQRAVEDAGGND